MSLPFFEFSSRGGVLFAIAAGLVGGSALRAQDVLVSIVPEPPGVEYRVDTATYYGPSSFTWPKGSKHIIQFVGRACNGGATIPTLQYDPKCRVRYTFSGWSTNKGGIVVGPVFPITADPEIHSVKLTVSPEYRVDLGLPNGPAAPAPLPVPTAPLGPRPSDSVVGLACVGGSCYHYATQLWLTPGEYDLQAFPYEGFAFTGWGGDSGTLQPFQSSFRVPGPNAIVPFFAPGKRVQIYTEPRELKVLIDRTEIPTIDPQYHQPGSYYPVPGYFDWAAGSVHTLAAPSPQTPLTGGIWVFDSWIGSNGEKLGGQNTEYKVANVNVRETLTAKFVPGVRVFFETPKGLKVSVDGRDNWATYNFVWAVGSKHTVSAPAEQLDSNGRKYIFKGWSNGGPGSQQIDVTADAITSGIRLKAEYELQGMLVVQSSVPGIRMTVDDGVCDAPCTLHRPIGTEVGLSAPDQLPAGNGTRLEFVAWNNGQDRQKTVRLGQEPVVLSASYRHAFLLTATAVPANSSDLRMDPPSPDGYYPANSKVTVYASARPGFKFRGWEGDLSGRFSPVSMTLGSPRTIRAVYDIVPHIDPAGIRNAAGEIPVSGVAPGSIVSIYGANLSPATLLGPPNPLVQTLGGTSVQTGKHILPIFFVSPEQINVQLPFDIPEGSHSLTVKNKDLPDVSGVFEVVRQAPGLFTYMQDGAASPVSVKADGALVTPSAPAKAGDLISLFGTGFGPHHVAPPEGFGVDESDAFRLSDPVEIVIGDRIVSPEYAGVAANLPGVIVVRFRVPSDLAAHSTNGVAVRVNGVSTNTVFLPMTGTINTASEDIQ